MAAPRQACRHVEFRCSRSAAKAPGYSAARWLCPRTRRLETEMAVSLSLSPSTRYLSSSKEPEAVWSLGLRGTEHCRVRLRVRGRRGRRGGGGGGGRGLAPSCHSCSEERIGSQVPLRRCSTALCVSECAVGHSGLDQFHTQRCKPAVIIVSRVET